MSQAIKEKLARIDALVMQRLQAAGEQGMNVCDMVPGMAAEFGHTEDYHRNRLIKLANDGAIYRRMVNKEEGGIMSRYFLREEWRDNFIAVGVPNRNVVAMRDPIVIPKMTNEIVYRDGIKVTVGRAFDGDYRIKVDPNHRGEFSQEWQKKRGEPCKL